MGQRCPQNDSASSTSPDQPSKSKIEPAKPAEPPVNLIQVKRKPGPVAPSSSTIQLPEALASSTKQAVTSSGEKEEKKGKDLTGLTVKKKRSGRVSFFID